MLGPVSASARTVVMAGVEDGEDVVGGALAMVGEDDSRIEA